MGLYSKYLFPLIVDWVLGRPSIGELRQELLGQIQGRVLEIGFGTGLNLSFYPPSVQEITVVDPNSGMRRRAMRRMIESGRRVTFHLLKGEDLPFPSESFDSIVSTFTLCSVGDLSRVLGEIRRVLWPEGRFFFLEHGLAPEGRIQVWQHRLTPLQKGLADGCHLDRDMENMLQKSGFRFQSLKKFYFSDFPKIAGYFYQGIAFKS